MGYIRKKAVAQAAKITQNTFLKAKEKMHTHINVEN
jgi:hypothetical protein